MTTKEGMMPKETITTPTGPYQVRVGWNHQGGVQVGVEGSEERSLFWLLLGHEETKAQVTAALQSGPLSADDLLNLFDVIASYRGIWSDLDRQGCNQLIRTVRRARDTAFGRDE